MTTTPPYPAPPNLMNEAQAAAFLTVAPKTLAAWRATKRTTGPIYLRIGGAVRYRVSDLQNFLENSVQEVKT